MYEIYPENSRYWAINRPSSTEDDSDDEKIYSTDFKRSKQSAKHKAELNRQQRTINQLNFEKQTAENRNSKLESELQDLKLELSSRRQLSNMINKFDYEEMTNELKSFKSTVPNRFLIIRNKNSFTNYTIIIM